MYLPGENSSILNLNLNVGIPRNITYLILCGKSIPLTSADLDVANPISISISPFENLSRISRLGFKYVYTFIPLLFKYCSI